MPGLRTSFNHTHWILARIRRLRPLLAAYPRIAPLGSIRQQPCARGEPVGLGLLPGHHTNAWLLRRAQASSRSAAPRNAAAERSDEALTAPSTARH
jgi:hypothetical protein